MGCIYARCEALGIYVHEFKEYKTKVCHSTCTIFTITPQQHVDKLSIKLLELYTTYTNDTQMTISNTWTDRLN